MRILSLVTTDLVYDQRMQRICATLTEAGYEVTLLGRRKPDSPPLYAQVFAQRRLRCWFHRGKLFYLEFNLRLFVRLLIGRYDAINAVDLDTLLPAVLVGRLRGKPVVYDAHEYFSETPEVVRRPRVQRVWEGVARWCIPRTAARYTVGPELTRVMGERYGVPFGTARNVPVPNARLPAHASPAHRGLDLPGGLPRSTTAPPEVTVPLLLYQGALNEGRGLPELLAALPHIPDAVLHLAGEGDLSDFLRAEVRRLKLTERVVFHGYLRPDPLRALTKRATIGLNLLENRGLSYYYSLANKAFDYLRAGVPSVHMDFPEYRALHEQYGVFSLLSDLEPESISFAIQKLLKEELYFRERQQLAVRAAVELTWDREAERLVEVYADLRM